MRRLDWGIIAAVIVCLILALVGLWDVRKSLNYSSKNQYPVYEEKIAEPSQNAALSVHQQQLAIKYREPCKNLRNDNDSELCAQWRAAKAAEKSADWTVFSFWASVAGMALLAWQIMLTRKAVKDTGDATKAMQVSNDIAREIHRPWLTISVEPHSFINTNIHSYTAKFTFENVGDSVALAVNFHGVIFYETPETRGGFWNMMEATEVHAGESRVSVVPRDKYIYHAAIEARSEDIRYWAEPGLINPVMIVTVFYRSTPDKKDWHRAIRAYRWGVDDGEGFDPTHYGPINDLLRIAPMLKLRPLGGNIAT